MIGIPQGSVLSTLLCSFFYGDLEKRFGKFTDDVHSVSLPISSFHKSQNLSWTDASTSRRRLLVYNHQPWKGSRFSEHDEQGYACLIIMNAHTNPKTGHPEYGCFISTDKTMSNFDYDDQIMNVTAPNQRCEHCGALTCANGWSLYRFSMVWIQYQYAGSICFCRLYALPGRL